MSKPITLNKKELLDRLEPVELQEKEETADSILEEMNLGASLLKLAEIDHESEYQLCRSIAERLLENVPEPDDLDTDIAGEV
jgi:hypothetical protein